VGFGGVGESRHRVVHHPVNLKVKGSVQKDFQLFIFVPRSSSKVKKTIQKSLFTTLSGTGLNKTTLVLSGKKLFIYVE